MRLLCAFTLLAGLAALAAGCGGGSGIEGFTGAKNDSFTGRLTHNGKAVKFPEGEFVQLTVFLADKGQRFGVPIKSDGTFTVGWMPIGKYSAILERSVPGGKGPGTKYSVPGGLTIEQGKTDYTIELGPGYKE